MLHCPGTSIIRSANAGGKQGKTHRMIAGLQLSHADILAHIDISKKAETGMLSCSLKLIDDVLHIVHFQYV